MLDLTETVIAAAFGMALVVFAVAAGIRSLVSALSADSAGPPRLPLGKVEVWAYRPGDILGVGLIFMIFSGLVLMSLRASGDSEMELSPAALIVSIGFQFFIAGIAMALMLGRVRPVEWLGLRWREWRWIFVIAPATVVLMWLIFGGLQASGYMRWMESLGVESVQETVKLLQESRDPLVLGLMAAAAIIAAPICEEIVFRGYVYPVAKRFAGPWAAGLSSALIFGAAHGSLAALLPLFVFGCVLTLLYELTGSLWAPVAVHLCFNGATVAVQMAARFYEIPLVPNP